MKRCVGCNARFGPTVKDDALCHLCGSMLAREVAASALSRPRSVQVNIRVPAELYERLEVARGSVERSTYILALLSDTLEDSKARARADALAYLASRGLTPSDLL
jgi:hypothetical protein